MEARQCDRLDEGARPVWGHSHTRCPKHVGKADEQFVSRRCSRGSHRLLPTENRVQGAADSLGILSVFQDCTQSLSSGRDVQLLMA
jgi:hypothetical protein